MKKPEDEAVFGGMHSTSSNFIFVFMILPTLNVFRMSLFEKGAYSPNETFVGLKNFKTLISDTNFIRSMQNMILLIVVVTIVTFAFALVFAGILSREKIRGQNFSVLFLYSQYFIGCSNCRYFFCNL